MTSDILDKIKKLLRLGADKAATREEAELAVQRAYELAARHQIDIQDISLEDDLRKILAENFPIPGRISFARKKILNLLPAFFNVNVVIQSVPKWARTATRQPHVTFIGTTVDIQIAHYVYDYLHTACKDALWQFCASKCGLNRTGSLRGRPAASTQKQFVTGFVYGVSHKLREAKASLTENQNALILHESARRDQFEQSAYAPKSLKPVKADPGRRNENAIHAGFIQGEKVEIRKPIATNATGQMLLT
jgi:hypothetical protein